MSSRGFIHELACNYQNGPVGLGGCICKRLREERYNGLIYFGLHCNTAVVMPMVVSVPPIEPSWFLYSFSVNTIGGDNVWIGADLLAYEMEKISWEDRQLLSLSVLQERDLFIEKLHQFLKSNYPFPGRGIKDNVG